MPSCARSPWPTPSAFRRMASRMTTGSRFTPRPAWTTKNLSPSETIADEVRIQPYYNCEVFSFNPRLGIAGEWARLLTRFLSDETYQQTVCTTFLRKLFLHQAVLSAVITSIVKPERIKTLPLTSGYPFSQHGRLPQAKPPSRLDDLSVRDLRPHLAEG